MSEGRYDWDGWSDDEAAWDTDTGAPGLSAFASAIQHWALFQNRADVTIAEAAVAFNVKPERVLEAVEHHVWMYPERGARPSGGTKWDCITIGHEGE